MLPVWKDFLASQGALVEGDRVMHFGNPGAELVTAKTDTILTDLSHLSLVEAAGEDAQAFLHGQFTNDVTKLGGKKVQLNGYCSPKGRLLATFFLWQQDPEQQDQCYRLQLPAGIAAPVLKRVSMFVLRSKVKLADISNQVIQVGLAGARAQQALTDLFGAAAVEPMSMLVHETMTIIALGRDRFVLLIAPAEAAAVWNRLCGVAAPVGSAVWDWLAIRAGEPMITTATQEQFVPQMVNFELLGGVNFQKGCYPGQEIVARTQYRGKLKRRMYLVHGEADGATPGTEIFSADMAGQASGMIVNAAPSPEGGIDALAVIQMESAANHPLHLGSPDGSLLKLQSLPYTVS